MFSQEKLLKALKTIANCLDDTDDKDIREMEAENQLLRQKKEELLTSISRTSPAKHSLNLVTDMLIRQKNFNQAYLESRQKSVEQFKERSSEVQTEICLAKQKLKSDEGLMTLPFHEVSDQIDELKKSASDNRSKIKELTQQYNNLLKTAQTEAEEAEHKRFIETLRSLAKEQRNLIEKHKQLKGSQESTKEIKRHDFKK